MCLYSGVEVSILADRGCFHLQMAPSLSTLSGVACPYLNFADKAIFMRFSDGTEQTADGEDERVMTAA